MFWTFVVIGIVSTILFGVSIFIAWRQPSKNQKPELNIYQAPENATSLGNVFQTSDSLLQRGKSTWSLRAATKRMNNS